MSGIKHILVFTLILLVFISNSPKIMSNNSALVYRTTFNLLAVDEQGNGNVVDVIFEVYYPGSGMIIVEPRDKVMDDVLVSIKYAIVLSSLLTGFNYTRFNYRYVFNVDVRIEGLSATLSFLLSFLGFARNVSTLGFSATGLVLPYGTVGLVSGIGAKYTAARERGLSKIMGPVYNADWEAYVGVPDIYTAFRLAYGKPLLPITGNESTVFYETRDLYDNVFRESTRELYEWINETMRKIRELGVDYSRSRGVELLNYSLKHYSEGRYYTASSYAFRAFHTLYSLYLTATLMSGVETYTNVVNEEIKWISWEITNTSSLINQYSFMNEIDLWDLDALINSYERLSIASKYLSVFIDASLDPRYIDNLALSKARAITAKQWLKLIKTHSNQTKAEINPSVVEKTKLSLKSFCSVASEYLAYVVQGSEFDFLNCSSLFADGLMGLIEFSLQLTNTYLILESTISKPIYETHFKITDLNNLQKTIQEINRFLYENVNTYAPSLLSTIELTNSYIEDGESISSIAYLLTNALSNTPIYIAIANVIGNKTVIINELEISGGNASEPVTRERVLSYETPMAAVLIVSAMTLSTGVGLVVLVLLKGSRREF